MAADHQPHYPLDPSLVAAQLAADPRVAQAKKLLDEAEKEHQKKLTAIRPVNPKLKMSYSQMLADFSNYRSIPLWFPYIGSGIGHGPFVELADGSVKYDFICGIGPHFFGHSHPLITETGIDSAISNTVMQGNLQQNVDSLELTKTLLDLSGLDHCFLSTSGAMANENALKLAFQAKFPAYRVLAFEKCFVGRSLAVSQITDKPSFREGLPPMLHVDYLPYFNPHHPEQSTRQAIQAFEQAIHRYPKQHALICFELVQGEAGFYAGTKEFFKEMMELARHHGIAVFADEVQSFARTPELFAFQYYKLQELVDLVTIGKISQVCATLFTKEYKPKPGLLSQTFTGSTSAIKASLAILKELVHGGYYGPEGKIAALHRYFVEHLSRLSEKYPDLIQGPYGVGCMVAFTAYGGDNKKTTDFVHRLFEAGIISFIAGSDPMRVRFLLPVAALTHRHIEEAMKIIEQTLKESH